MTLRAWVLQFFHGNSQYTICFINPRGLKQLYSESDHLLIKVNIIYSDVQQLSKVLCQRSWNHLLLGYLNWRYKRLNWGSSVYKWVLCVCARVISHTRICIKRHLPHALQPWLVCPICHPTRGGGGAVSTCWIPLCSINSQMVAPKEIRAWLVMTISHWSKVA